MEYLQVSKSAIEIPRNPMDLCRWVEGMREQLSSDPDRRRAFRVRYGKNVKELMEEIYPVCIFMKAEYGFDSPVSYQPKIGNQPYDGVIADGNQVILVEVTVAMDGKDEKNRMTVLNEQGHVPASGPMDILVSKSACVTIEESVSLVGACIRKKSQKIYASGTILLVALCDSLIDAKYVDALLGRVRQAASEFPGSFAKIYLVRTHSGKVDLVSN